MPRPFSLLGTVMLVCVWTLNVQADTPTTAPTTTPATAPVPLHWAEPFTRLNARGAYVSVIQRNHQVELWNVQWDGMNAKGSAAERNQLTVVRGPDIDHLGDETIVQSLRPLITDVVDPKNPENLAPWRAMTRQAVIFDEKEGYILSGCVVPEYLPGSVPLLPAIFTSPTGETGTWKYHGILKPEPLDESLKQKTPVWCDGGGLVRLADGRWRLYANNYVENFLSAAEAPGLDGPWKFLRDEKGNIRNLSSCYSDATHSSAFPSVLRVSEHEWHLWLSNGWPVREIYHLWSTDGLDWKLFGKQPELTPAMFEGRDIKCVRAFLDPDGKHIVGLLSIDSPWKGENQWVSFKSRMEVGAPKE